MVGNYVMTVGAQAPTYVVPVLVGATVSASQTAYFYAAWRIGSLFFLAAGAVTNALFAEGAHAAAHSVRRAQLATLFLVPVLLVLTVILVVAGPLLLGAFGSDYRSSALGLLLLLIVAAIPDAITAVYRTVLRIGHQYLQGGILMWGLTAIQVGMTWPLVAMWGISGAGVAWLTAESVGVVVAGMDRWLHGDFATRAEERAQEARARARERGDI
jgi:O-antigen/teichoic acid export membrane protein